MLSLIIYNRQLYNCLDIFNTMLYLLMCCCKEGSKHFQLNEIIHMVPVEKRKQFTQI